MVIETARQDFMLTTTDVIYLTIISYSYHNPAKYYQVLLTLNIIIMLEQLSAAGEGTTVE